MQTFLPNFCIVNSMCICRQLLFITFSAVLPHGHSSYLHTLFDVDQTTANWQGFTRRMLEASVSHAEPLFGALHITISEVLHPFIWFIYSYLLAVGKAFYHIYAIA